LNSIDILVEEHNNIKRVLKIARNMCVKVVEGEEVDYSDFHLVIDFVRNYADKYHHGKEEDMLFKDMAVELVDIVGTGPIQGMFIEHDYGRSFIRDLEAALQSYEGGNKDAKVDIVANAMGYANLLTRHIHKEDNVIYKFANNHLKKETLSKLDSQFEDFEGTDEHLELKKKYADLIEKLEGKY